MPQFLETVIKETSRITPVCDGSGLLLEFISSLSGINKAAVVGFYVFLLFVIIGCIILVHRIVLLHEAEERKDSPVSSLLSLSCYGSLYKRVETGVTKGHSFWDSHANYSQYCFQCLWKVLCLLL